MIVIFYFYFCAAIVLPEQSMVSERKGMAVNSRGLTLKELLQQTSHHNVKTRKGMIMCLLISNRRCRMVSRDVDFF